MRRRAPPASLRLRLLVALARRTLKPRTLSAPDPEASRLFVDRFALPALLTGARLSSERIGGVPGEWASDPATGRGTPVMIYLHGGAYAIGSPRTHRPITAAFARRGFRVFAPDYRLAPEHPFPAALEDAIAVTSALLAAGTDPGRLVFAGESAGGGLTLATLVRMRELGLPQPAGAALFSPWTDLAVTGESIGSNARRDSLFDARHAHAVARLYLGGADPRDPLASPLYADLSGLPPLLIHVGADEVLRDDAVRVAARAQEAGVSVALSVWPAVPHAWQLLPAILPEARRSVDEAAAFLRAASRRGRDGRAMTARAEAVGARPVP